VAARPAIVGVPIEVGAAASLVPALSEAAVGRLCGADVSAGPTVVRIVIQVGAYTAAVDCALRAPVLTPSVHAVAILVRARLGAADIGTAGAAQAPGFLVARIAGRQASVLLRLVATPAEGLAGIRLASPGGSDPQRAEQSAGQRRSQQAQRLAPRNGLLRQRFREFIPVICHGRCLSTRGRSCQLRRR